MWRLCGAAPQGRAPARSRPPCAACHSPAAAAPARPPAAPHPRACHRQRKVRSTQQDPRRLSSVPEGLRTSRASHHSCGEGLQSPPSRRSDVRAVASNAAVAVVAATRLRVQPLAVRLTRPFVENACKKRSLTCSSLRCVWCGTLKTPCVDWKRSPCVHTEGVFYLHTGAGVQQNKHARSYQFAIYRVHTCGSALMIEVFTHTHTQNNIISHVPPETYTTTNQSQDHIRLQEHITKQCGRK